MCGIVGAIRAQDNVVDFLTDGLKRLEYRGYDSSGIAVQTDEGLKRVRRVGRVALMEAAAKGSTEVDPVSLIAFDKVIMSVAAAKEIEGVLA